jgi:hypothetical protein
VGRGSEELRASVRDSERTYASSAIYACVASRRDVDAWRRMHISAPPAARPVGPGKFGDRDRGPRAGGCGAVRAGGAARLGADLRVYISAPPGRRRRPRRHRTRKRTVGPAWSVSEPEELLESERELRVDACSAMHLGTAGRDTRKGTALSRLGAGPVRSQQEAGRSCATRNGSTRLQ